MTCLPLKGGRGEAVGRLGRVYVHSTEHKAVTCRWRLDFWGTGASITCPASKHLPTISCPMPQLSIDPSSRLLRYLGGRDGSKKHRSNSNVTRHRPRAQHRSHQSHTSRTGGRDRYEEDSSWSARWETEVSRSPPGPSYSSYQTHGAYSGCQQCLDTAPYSNYASYSEHTPQVSYQQTVPLTIPLTVPLTVPPPIYDYGIPSPGPVPYSQSYGYSPHTPNYPQSTGFSPQTPNYPRGADYRSRESASSGYRGTGVSEQQPRGRKCIFCGNPGLNLTDEKDGKILHPYLVQRNSEGETVLMGDSLDEAHGVACPAHMSKLMKLWNEACDAQDGFVEFDPGPYFSEYGKWRSYIFASRKAYGKHSFLEVDYEVESAV